MQNLTQMSLQNSKKKKSNLELVLDELTNSAFQVVKAYFEGITPLEEATVRLTTIKAQLESLHYRLAVGEGMVAVTSLKPSFELFLNLSFCRDCEQPSTRVCCFQHWCDNCFETHRVKCHHELSQIARFVQTQEVSRGRF